MLELELFWNIALGQINVNQRYILNSNALIVVLLSSGASQSCITLTASCTEPHNKRVNLAAYAV